ncbi:MAG: hypothetical protein GU354_00375 [Caldimicrobium sp.]|nr:hypothetical protein [Caldimicrobium sp.]
MAGLKPTEEQLAYASLLDLGRKIGFIGLVITFIIYLFQLLPSYIPPNELLSYLKLNLHDYLEKTGIQQGWFWITMLRYGDFLTFLPICFLAFVTIFCFLRIIPIFLKKGDKVYAFLSLLQALILLLAASGFLKVGH